MLATMTFRDLLKASISGITQVIFIHNAWTVILMCNCCLFTFTMPFVLMTMTWLLLELRHRKVEV